MRRWVLAPLAFCVLAIVSGMPAAPDSVLPDAQALQAQMDVAMGPPSGNYRETIVGTGDEGVTVSSRYRRGDDELVTRTRGPIRTSYGTYRGTDWHQDANGISVADEPDPGPVARLKTTASVQRVSSPVDAYVLTELDGSGNGTRDYVDPASYLVLRHDQIGASGTTTTTNTAYARFGAQLLPAAWRVEDHPFNETMSYTRTRFVADSTREADVAIPALRQIVSLPAGKTIVDLHARFENGQISVPVRIAGRTFFFLLDSGASSITIDSGVARDLGLVLTNAKRQTAGKRFETRDTVVPAMEVSGLQMNGVVVSVLPHGATRNPADPVGLLGFDFFAELVVRIDYEHKRVIAMDARSYEPPSGTDVSVLAVRLNAQVPMISANLGGAVAHRLIVDTGSPSALLLFDYFSRQHGEVLRFAIDDAQELRGIGGSFTSRPFRMDYVHVGDVSIAGLVADVVTSRGAYPQDNDGLIGADFLQFFTVDVDYVGGRIVLRTRPSLRNVVS
jgi:predicted aspartyl protease